MIFSLVPKGFVLRQPNVCAYYIGLIAACCERRPRIELVIAGEIAAGGHIIGRAGVKGEEGCQRETIGRGEVAQYHETVMNIEARSSVVKPRILRHGRSIGHAIRIRFGDIIAIEGEETEVRIARPAQTQ